MRDPQLEQDFPKLSTGGYSIKSPYDPSYNCVAFAVGNPTRWWDWMPYPTGGYYWPPGIGGSNGSVEDWMKAFALHGYRECANGRFEKGLEKVAFYVDVDGDPTHVAKQDISTGKWISKLGKDYDIDHISLELLAGFENDEYGRIAKYMSRRCQWPRRSLWFRFRSLLARVISPT